MSAIQLIQGAALLILAAAVLRLKNRIDALERKTKDRK